MKAVLPAVPGSLSRARLMVGNIRDAPSEALENAKLVLTELLANEIKHGRYGPGDPLVCRVERERSALRIEVRHSGPSFNMPTAPAHPALEVRESGWGLALITRIADRWGLSDQGGARQVWAEIDVPDRDAPPFRRAG
jgi:anti-sigma regulatory factor (Ser/Thr protein kinase)